MYVSNRTLISIALTIEFITGLVTAHLHEYNMIYPIVAIIIGSGIAAVIVGNIE